MNAIERTKRNFADQQGFTLIELLVVILIIGILAAIAIPSFLAQRDKSQDTCAKTQARTMSTAMEAYYVETNTYSADLAVLHEIETAVVTDGACGATTSATVVGGGSGAGGNCTAGSVAGAYCVSQTSPSGATFAISKVPYGAATRTCGPAERQGKGACPETGIW